MVNKHLFDPWFEIEHRSVLSVKSVQLFSLLILNHNSKLAKW